jgi:hypothetical protein
MQLLRWWRLGGLQLEASPSKGLARPHLNKQAGHSGAQCNPNFMGGIGKEDFGLRLALGKNERPYLKNN